MLCDLFQLYVQLIILNVFFRSPISCNIITIRGIRYYYSINIMNMINMMMCKSCVGKYIVFFFLYRVRENEF